MEYLVLHSAYNGAVLATMDAAMITALRTGAIGAMGLDIIAPQDIHSIGILGCGVQGIWQSIFAAHIRPITRIFCHSRSVSKLGTFINEITRYHDDIDIIWCDQPDDVVRQTSTIYGCTNSLEPVFSNDEEMIRGKQFISVGSFSPDMQEFPGQVYQSANRVIVDTMTAQSEVGDLINCHQEQLDIRRSNSDFR